MSLIISKARIGQHEPLKPQYLKHLWTDHEPADLPVEIDIKNSPEQSIPKHELPWRLVNLSDSEDTQTETPCASSTFEVTTSSPRGFNDTPVTVLTNLPIPPTLPLYYIEFEPDDKMNFEFFAGVTSVRIPETEIVTEIHDSVEDTPPVHPQTSERNRTISLLLGELIDSDNIEISFGVEDIDEDIQDFSEYRYGNNYEAEEEEEDEENRTETGAAAGEIVGNITEEAMEEEGGYPQIGEAADSMNKPSNFKASEEYVPEIDFDNGIFSSITGDESYFPMSLTYKYDIDTDSNSEVMKELNAALIENTKSALIKDEENSEDVENTDDFAIQIVKRRSQLVKLNSESIFSSMSPDLDIDLIPQTKSPLDHQLVHASYYWHNSDSGNDESTFQVGPDAVSKICYLDARSAICGKRDPYRTKTQIPQPLHRFGIIVDTQKGEVNYTANGILLKGTTRWVEGSRMEPGGRANFPYIAAYGGKYTAHFGDESIANDGFSFDIQSYMHYHERAKAETHQSQLLKQSRQLMRDYFYLYGYGSLDNENEESEKMYQLRKQIRQVYSTTKDLTQCYDICCRNRVKLSPKTEFLYEFCQFVNAANDPSNPKLALECARKLSMRDLTEIQEKLVVSAAQLLGAPRPLTKELAFYSSPQFRYSVISGIEKDLSDSKNLHAIEKLGATRRLFPQNLL